MREHHDTPGEVELVLKIVAGTIDIETVDEPVTEFDVDDDDVRIDVTTANARRHRIVLEQRAKKAFGWNKREVHVRVSVPHGATIKGDTGSADLRIEGVVGDVEFASGSGDVDIERARGDVSIRAASADVRIAHVDGTARFETASGDVTLDEIGDDLSVRSASGDVRVGTAQASVQITTASGDITLDEVANGRAAVNSMSGDIHVGVRPGTRVWLDVSSTSGDVTSELLSSDGDDATDAALEIRATTLSGDVMIERSSRTAA